jgi:hypothetical protein
MTATTATGPLTDCVATLHRFADAGVDEFVIHGCSVTQAAGLPAAWAEPPPALEALHGSRVDNREGR